MSASRSNFSKQTFAKKSSGFEQAKVKGIQDTMKDAYGIPGFNITVEESNMVSLPQRTVERNQTLAALLGGLGRPAVVVDGYACVGGDTLSFAQMAERFGLKLEILAVQKSSREEGDDKNRFARLKNHVGLYFKHNSTSAKLSAKVSLINAPVQDFIVKNKKEVDLLYLDPNWNLPEGFDLSTNRGTDRKPSLATSIYIDRVQSEVFGPMLASSHSRPKFICLKAPTPFVEFSLALFEAAPFVRGYELLKSIPFRDKRGAIRLYYHVLVDHKNKTEDVVADAMMKMTMNPDAHAFVPSGL
jgi:hypothetical protein